MATAPAPIDIENLLDNIPSSLRNELLGAFNQISTNYRERRWEPSELNGGKLCEVVYSIIRGYVDGAFPSSSSKPRNMFDACRALEHATGPFPRSIKIQIPRMLIALYEIRNNRGVGHVGGDVNPNNMDATCVLYMSKWIVAELVRVFHAVDSQTAEAAVDAIVERTLPVVWKVGSNLRVLDTRLTMREKTLLLLYHGAEALSEKDLVHWTEHSNAGVYRRDILRPLHQSRMIEYDEQNRLVHLSPLGMNLVETEVLPRISSK